MLDFFNNTYSGKTQFEPCVLLKYQFGANPNAEPILSSNLTFGENVIVSGPWRRILNHVVPFLYLFSHLLTKQLKRKRQVDFFSLAFPSVWWLTKDTKRNTLDILFWFSGQLRIFFLVVNAVMTIFIRYHHYSQGYPEKCFLDFKMIASCMKIAPKWEWETFFLVSMAKRRIKTWNMHRLSL